MQLTDRFLDFSDQQLAPLAAIGRFLHLGLYVSAPPEQSSGPPLILIRQWSAAERALPAVEDDTTWRLPNDQLRWYPLQDSGLILPCAPISHNSWTSDLDQQMRLSASAISHALGRDLECMQLQRELSERRDQLRALVHQLRNPLAALRTYAQLLLRRLEPDSEQRSLVQGLLEEQKQLGRYVEAIDNIDNQTLSSAKTIQGPMLLPPVSTEPGETLKHQLTPLIERARHGQPSGSALVKPQPLADWSTNRSEDVGTLEIVANLLEMPSVTALQGRPLDCNCWRTVCASGTPGPRFQRRNAI